MPPAVVVAGALANKPGNGGEAWVRLSWVLGLQRLGCEVSFVEQIDPAECTVNAREWFAHTTERFGLGDDACLCVSGTSTEKAEQALTEADLLVNISGNLTDPLLLSLPRTRAYLDLDPGYTQIWQHQGALGNTLDSHEHLLTVALSIDGTRCTLPLGGRRWRSTPPPVVLDEWPVTPLPAGERARLTTVGAWRGGYGRLEYDGHAYGQKAHEFRRLAQLPRLTAGPVFEAALAIEPWDEDDRRRLVEHGWLVVDPQRVVGDADAFREYVRGSTGELSPAQGVYVETRCGWFSDRTARYLASGRPAIVQDTSLPDSVPTGVGLLTFATPSQAAVAVEAVLSELEAHARTARNLAEELLDSARVISAVLQDVLP